MGFLLQITHSYPVFKGRHLVTSKNVGAPEKMFFSLYTNSLLQIPSMLIISEEAVNYC